MYKPIISTSNKKKSQDICQNTSVTCVSVNFIDIYLIFAAVLLFVYDKIVFFKMNLERPADPPKKKFSIELPEILRPIERVNSVRSFLYWNIVDDAVNTA